MISEQEMWKDIPGYEGRYQVSTLGNVKSINRRQLNVWGSYSTYPDRLLTPITSSQGYKHVILYRDNNKKVKSIHQLVALTFIPRVNGKTDVNHKNGIKHDNHLSNLEWSNDRENVTHAFKRKKTSSKYTGVCRHGEKWMAYIDINGKRRYLGKHSSEEQAANAYKKALTSYQLTNKYAA